MTTLDSTGAEVHPVTVHDLVKVDCTAEPAHEPMWMKFDDELWWAPSCPICSYERERDAHAGCRHSHHRAWRRWKITRRALGWAYSMGLVSGWGQTYDGYCNGCVSGVLPVRGRRTYALGWPTWKWGCLFKGRHWPGQFIGLGLCTKCAPCPECGSTEADHDVFHEEGSRG